MEAATQQNQQVIIHPTAIVDSRAILGVGVKVGPYSLIGPQVVIGDYCLIGPHVVLDGNTVIGRENQFYQFCSIGAPPQDLTYKGENTTVVIGDQNIFREYVSVHRGTMKEQGFTKMGNRSLLMAHVHVGHDVIIGDHCVVANSVNFAGHVKIADRVIIGGGTQISQFITLGRGAYIGGATAIDRDIPCFCTAYGNRARLKGINIVGMKRQGFSKQVISEVVDFFRLMESSALSPRSFIEKDEMIKEYAGNEVVAELIKTIHNSEVGIAPFMES